MTTYTQTAAHTHPESAHQTQRKKIAFVYLIPTEELVVVIIITIIK